MALCYLIGLTYAAKQQDLKQPGRLWSLAFLGASFVYGLPIAGRSFIGLAVYAALLVAVVWAIRPWSGATGPISPGLFPS